MDVAGRVVRGERGDAGDAGDDRPDGEALAEPRPLAEQPLAGRQQHDQSQRERRLHDDERRVGERDDLQGPAERRHAGAEQPAHLPRQLTEERDSQRVSAADVARVERLNRDP